jgi:hypothetical protein
VDSAGVFLVTSNDLLRSTAVRMGLSGITSPLR